MLALVVALVGIAGAQTVEPGKVIEKVVCAENPEQSYALYLPSNYTPDRPWNLLLGFDPRARGTAAVTPYREAAEKYGYIVVGSNNSRNGSWQATTDSIAAMSKDVTSRFAIDARRMYTAGLSGGARVAMAVAMGGGKIAGAIPSSAGYPDSKPRKTLPFVVFGTAGTEDFNYLELRDLDRALTTPHRVVIFEGGHTWLPESVAMEAIEWMELQAMRAGLRPKDQRLIEGWYQSRWAKAKGDDRESYAAVQSIAADFEGLHDTSEASARLSQWKTDKHLKDVLKKDRAALEREDRAVVELNTLVAGMDSPETLAQLKGRLQTLGRESKAADDSETRRMARRLLRGAAAGAREQSKPELRKLLAEYLPPGGPR